MGIAIDPGRRLRDRLQVAREVVRELRIRRRVDGMRGRDEAEGVAVGRRVRGELHADRPRRAGAIVHDYGLVQLPAQFLRHDARRDVGRASG